MVTENDKLVDYRMLEEVRGNLLAYYTSQITAHGNYIIALFIGFLTLLSVFNSLPAIPAYLLVSILFGLLVCISGRTVFYGYLILEILQVDPELEMSKDTPIMNRLHLDAIRKIRAVARSDASEKISRRERYWYKIAISFGTFRFGIMILSSLIALGVLLLAHLILSVHGFI
ncbi:hypothetical protein MUP79_08160 [Candidatus Bathyarchaeota archaeon]|nr:hypothetical protein [Candidatus Bathyarchaeota archaeon]